MLGCGHRENSSFFEAGLCPQPHLNRLLGYRAGRYQSGQMGRAVNPLRKRFGGSNPSLPIKAGIAQLVERRPSKPSVAGSSPVSRSFAAILAQVAQSVEHVLGKDGVTSSILVLGSRIFSSPYNRRLQHGQTEV